MTFRCWRLLKIFLFQAARARELYGCLTRSAPQRAWTKTSEIIFKIFGLRCQRRWLAWVDLRRVNVGVWKRWEKSCKKWSRSGCKITHKAESAFASGAQTKVNFIVSWINLGLTLNLAGQLIPLEANIFQRSDRLDRHLPDFQWIGGQNGRLDVATVGVQAAVGFACVQLNHLVHFHVGDENRRVHVQHQQCHADEICYRRWHLRKRRERRRSSKKKSCKQWKRRRIELKRICLQNTERHLQKFYWNRFVISSKFCLLLLRS